MAVFPKPIHLSHQLLTASIKLGDRVVDATLGNGHDALFLAKLVGDKGLVYGFDVQKPAIVSSSLRLESEGISNFEFYHTGHERMVEMIEGDVSAVMFNLGYLPQADKTVITQTKTTLAALEQALQIIKENGVVSVMCYPGHVGGDDESEEVIQWASMLERSHFRVAKYELLNAPNKPPFLLLIEKLRN